MGSKSDRRYRGTRSSDTLHKCPKYRALGGSKSGSTLELYSLHHIGLVKSRIADSSFLDLPRALGCDAIVDAACAL